MGKKTETTAAKEYKESEILAAIPDSYGIMSRIAVNLGCTWGTANKYVHMYPAALQMIAEEQERVKDLCETKVIKSINLDDIQTAKWYLMTKGKDRGYAERQEITGANGGPLAVSFDVNKLSTDEAAALLDLIEKAKE